VSISKFQEKFLGKGCGVAIGIVMALTFLGLGFNQCSRGAAANGNSDASQEGPVAIASVGGIPVTSVDVTAAQDALQQQSQTPDSSYSAMARLRGQAISFAASRAAIAYIAQRDHIPVDDAAVLKVRQSAMQMQIQQAEDALIATKKLKNPTPAQLAAAFEAQYKKKPQQIIDESTDAIKKQLADKEQHAALMADSVPMIVESALETKYTPTDDQLRSAYNTYKVKRIFLNSTKNPNLDAAIAKVLTALKGGTSFDEAIDKYSNDPTPPGKKLSANTTTVPGQLIDYEPEYKDLKGQKVGFVSNPESVMGGKAIFDIVGITTNPPKDFQSNLAKYRSDYAKGEAGKELQKEITDVLGSTTTTWNNPGYKALYDVQAALGNPMLGNSPASLQKFIDEAKTARSGSGSGEVPANDAYFLASDALYNSPGADKTKLRDERIDALSAALQSNEDFDLRLELADLYAQKKDEVNALDQLQKAAEANTVYDVTGQRHFGDVAAKRETFIKSGLAKEKDMAAIDAAQDAWRKSKVDQDKQDAEMKEQEAIQKQKDAELAKQNEAEIARQKATAPKSGPSSSLAPSKPASGSASAPSSSGSKFIPEGSSINGGK
jgi:hypothetical protein